MCTRLWISIRIMIRIAWNVKETRINQSINFPESRFPSRSFSSLFICSHYMHLREGNNRCNNSMLTRPFHLTPSCWPTQRPASTRQTAIGVAPEFRPTLHQCEFPPACPPESWSSSVRIWRVVKEKYMLLSGHEQIGISLHLLLYMNKDTWGSVECGQSGMWLGWGYNHLLDCLHHG